MHKRHSLKQVIIDPTGSFVTLFCLSKSKVTMFSFNSYWVNKNSVHYRVFVLFFFQTLTIIQIGFGKHAKSLNWLTGFTEYFKFVAIRRTDKKT